MGRLIVALVVVLAAVAYVVVQMVRPVPAPTAVPASADGTVPGAAPALSWPSQGEAAFGLQGTGLIAQHGSQTPTPLASLTKMMTAYVVLHDHPLANGKTGTTSAGTGPQLTVSSADVALYQKEKAATDSTVQVVTGERLSERQALEALLIPSGDNIATLLANWDAGNEAAFVKKMNADATSLGLSHTHYVDPSGVQPGNTSTAADQVRLAAAAMTIAAFRQIVSMAQVTLPVVGVQYNVDSLLGTDGIVGVKTGWTPEAGGCFLFAAGTSVDGNKVTVIGAVLHQAATTAQPSALQAAFDASTSLLKSAESALVRVQVVKAGAKFGSLEAPWASSVVLRAARSVSVYGLPGTKVSTQVSLPRTFTAPVASGQHLGTATVTVGSQQVTIPLTTGGKLPSASLKWRLTRI